MMLQSAGRISGRAERFRQLQAREDSYVRRSPTAEPATSAPWEATRTGVLSSMDLRTGMTRRKPTTIVANDPDDLKGVLKQIGGSQSDRWNSVLATQAVQTLWVNHSNKDTC